MPRKLTLAPGAARHRVGRDVAERPLRGGVPRVFHDRLHPPRVVAALAEHAREHLAQRRVPRVRAEERVGVGRAFGEARDERRRRPAVLKAVSNRRTMLIVARF